MAMNSLLCADVPLRNCSLTHCNTGKVLLPIYRPRLLQTAHDMSIYSYYLFHAESARQSTVGLGLHTTNNATRQECCRRSVTWTALPST